MCSKGCNLCLEHEKIIFVSMTKSLFWHTFAHSWPTVRRSLGLLPQVPVALVLLPEFLRFLSKFFIFLPPFVVRSSGGITFMPAWSCVCLCVIILVYTFLHFGIHFFIGLYLFNTATDHVHFWHACTLGPGLYSPNVFGDAALINYANLCKICQSVNILVYIFLHFGIHFCTFWYTPFYIKVYIFLIQQLIGFIFGMHVP